MPENSFIKGKEVVEDNEEHKWLMLDYSVSQALTQTSIEDLALLVPYIKVGILKKTEEGKRKILWVCDRFFNYSCQTQEEYVATDGRPSYSLVSFNVASTEAAVMQAFYKGSMVIKIHSKNSISQLSGEQPTYDDFFLALISQVANIVVEMGYNYEGNNELLEKVTKKPLFLIMQPVGYNVAIDPTGQFTLTVQLVDGGNNYMQQVNLGEGSIGNENIASVSEALQNAENKLNDLPKTQDDIYSKAKEALDTEIDSLSKQYNDKISKRVQELIKDLPKYDNDKCVLLGDVFYNIIGPSLASTFALLAPGGAKEHTIYWGRFPDTAGIYAGKTIYMFKILKEELLNRVREWGTQGFPIKLSRFIAEVLETTRDSNSYLAPQEKSGEKKSKKEIPEKKAEDKKPFRTPELVTFIDTEWDKQLGDFIFSYYIYDRMYGISELNRIRNDLANSSDTNTLAGKKNFLQTQKLPFVELMNMNSLIKTQNIAVQDNEFMKTMILTRNASGGMNVDTKSNDLKVGADSTKSQFKDAIFLPIKLSLGIMGFPKIKPYTAFYFFTGLNSIPQWEGFYNITSVTHEINAAAMTTTLECIWEKSA